MADAAGAPAATATASTAPVGGAASGPPMNIIGGASATLVLWWAFSTLLAKDYGKPLFRRRIESPAHEGAS